MFKKWAKATAVRTVRTMAQTVIATIGTTALITEVDWRIVASATAMAGVLCVLTAVAGLPEVEGESDEL